MKIAGFQNRFHIKFYQIVNHVFKIWVEGADLFQWYDYLCHLNDELREFFEITVTIKPFKFFESNKYTIFFLLPPN